MLVKKIRLLLNYRYLPIIMYFLLFLSVLSLNYFHKKYIQTINNKFIFILWLAIFIQSIMWFMTQVRQQTYIRVAQFLKKEWKILVSLFFLALITRLIVLTQYPFLNHMDELRDAGLNGLRIKKGLIQDFFGLGSYQGYGNFIPLISYFFSLFINNSVLIFRLPSALTGIFSILLTYCVARICFNKKIALISSLLLLVSFVHLHYSRTELLVIMDSFLAVLVIIAGFFSITQTRAFFVLGLIIGFSLHFYAGIRGIIVSCILYLAILFLADFIKVIKRGNFEEYLVYAKRVILSMSLFIMGFMIALGPTINFLRKDNLVSKVGTAKLIISDTQFKEKSSFEKLNQIYKSYEKAFLVYIFEPTADPHFKYYAPLLSFPLNWFFLTGMFLLFIFADKEKQKFRNLLLVGIFLIPYTNEVLVGQVGIDHRLMSVVPLLNIVSASGMVYIVERVSLKFSKIILIFLLTIFSVFQLYRYFGYRLSDQFSGSEAVKEFVFQEALFNIKNYPKVEQFYVLNNAPFNYDFLHYAEKIEFFTYPKNFELLEKEKFLATFQAEKQFNTRKTLFVMFEDIPELASVIKQKFMVSCRYKAFLFPKFNCPKDFEGDYSYFFLN